MSYFYFCCYEALAARHRQADKIAVTPKRDASCELAKKVCLAMDVV